MAKKIAAYIIVALILIITFISILAVWDIVQVKDILSKTFQSLFILFLAAVIILFVFSVIIKDSSQDK